LQKINLFCYDIVKFFEISRSIKHNEKIGILIQKLHE